MSLTPAEWERLRHAISTSSIPDAISEIVGGLIGSRAETSRTHARTARGTVHALTLGRKYTCDGRSDINRVGSAAGKADCGAITSGAATVTTEPLTCADCLKKSAR